MIRRPPRSTQSRSSAASDVYKRQVNMSGFDELQVAVERGEREAVVSMVKDALDGGTDPAEILNVGLIAAMQAVGEKMEEGDMFIPEVLRAAKTMQAGLEILEPHLVEGTVE